MSYKHPPHDELEKLYRQARAAAGRRLNSADTAALAVIAFKKWNPGLLSDEDGLLYVAEAAAKTPTPTARSGGDTVSQIPQIRPTSPWTMAWRYEEENHDGNQD